MSRTKGARNKTPEEREVERKAREAKKAERKNAPWAPSGKTKELLDLLVTFESGTTVKTLAAVLKTSEDAVRMNLSTLEKHGFVMKFPVTFKAVTD